MASKQTSTDCGWLAAFPKDAAPKIAAETDYLLNTAALGARGTPLSLSMEGGKRLAPFAAELSKCVHMMTASALTFDSMAIFMARSNVGMEGLSTYFRAVAASARSDAAAVADFVNVTGGVVSAPAEAYGAPCMEWGCADHSDVTACLAKSAALTKVAIDHLDKLCGMASDLSFAAGSAFVDCLALQQVETLRDKCALLSAAKAAEGNLAALKILDRALPKENNFKAAAASAQSVLPLRFVAGAKALEAAHQVEVAAAPYMKAACAPPVLNHSLMG